MLSFFLSFSLSFRLGFFFLRGPDGVLVGVSVYAKPSGSFTVSFGCPETVKEAAQMPPPTRRGVIPKDVLKEGELRRHRGNSEVILRRLLKIYIYI